MSVIESLMAISCIASHQCLLMPSLSPNCCSIQAERFSEGLGHGQPTPLWAPQRGPPRPMGPSAANGAKQVPPGDWIPQGPKKVTFAALQTGPVHSRATRIASTPNAGVRISACARTADQCVQLCLSGPDLVWLDLECSPTESARVSPVETGICLLSLARGLGS